MRRIIEKADILIEALPYLRAFRGKVFVIKYGGRAIMSDKGKRSILQDVVFLSSVGICPVLVHGGGPHITAKLEERGERARFIEGRRMTDERVIRVVDEVLSDLNRQLVREIREELEGHAQGFHGKDGLFKIRPEPTGTLGYVGEITQVNVSPLRKLLRQGVVPVVSPISRWRDGQLYNVNADEAATKMAEAMQAEKLVFFTDTNGILRDQKNPESRIPTIRVPEVERLISKRIVEHGMIPKTRAAVHALSKGVKKVHIISGSFPRALLLEIFTEKGIGTEIVK